jgi:hypothetical protein
MARSNAGYVARDSQKDLSVQSTGELDAETLGAIARIEVSGKYAHLDKPDRLAEEIPSPQPRGFAFDYFLRGSKRISGSIRNFV